METTTPFDLNLAIQRWRENLAQSPAFRNENLYELETHLRDSIKTLCGNRLSDEEAFIIAAKRLGKSSQLEAEFAKQNTRSVWLDRALWILLGGQFWGLASVLSFSLTTFLQAAVPKINERLNTYGFGRISESIPGHVFYVITLPLIVLAGAKAFSAIHHWTERRGWFPLNFILTKPRLLASLYGLLFLLPLGIQYGVTMLVQYFGLQRFYGMSSVSGFGLYVLVVFQVAIFGVIVLVIGKRRLQVSQL